METFIKKIKWFLYNTEHGIFLRQNVSNRDVRIIDSDDPDYEKIKEILRRLQDGEDK